MKGKKVIHWGNGARGEKSFEPGGNGAPIPPWHPNFLTSSWKWGKVLASSLPLGSVLISSWKCNFSIYLDIQVYYLDIQAITTLLCLLMVLYVLVPFIHSFYYLTTTLLKSDMFWHSKAYSSHSFQPTGIGLCSLWRGNRCVFNYLGLPINW